MAPQNLDSKRHPRMRDRVECWDEQYSFGNTLLKNVWVFAMFWACPTMASINTCTGFGIYFGANWVHQHPTEQVDLTIFLKIPTPFRHSPARLEYTPIY